MPTDHRSDEPEERLEKRVRRVQHLDAFEWTLRGDGRFACHLDRPARELEPEDLRAVIGKLDRIRARLERELKA